MEILIIVVLVVVGILFLSTAKNPDKEQTPTRTVSSASVTSRNFKIAGISRRCSKRDIGIIMGAVVNDKNNPHDPYAKAVIANYGQSDERLLGYIAKTDQYNYERLAQNATELPFVGFIEEFEADDNRMAIFGKIKVFSGNSTAVENAMSENMKYIANAFSIKNYEDRMKMLDTL